MKYSVTAESELDAKGAKKPYDIFANCHTKNNRQKAELHTHSYYETLMVSEGRLLCYVPNEAPITLSPGDVIFFPPHMIHATAVASDTVMRSTVVKFSPLFLYPMETTRSDVDCLLVAPNYKKPYYLFRRGESEASALALLLTEILAEYSARRAGYELALRGALISLYIRLVRACSTGAAAASCDEKIDAYTAHKLHRALQYLAENYPYSISMGEVAAHCGMSYYQFSRFFKRVTHKSFSEYLLEMRLFYAQKKLLQGEGSISEIAMACGFEYVAYFIQKFKQKNGMTPREYQKLYKEHA